MKTQCLISNWRICRKAARSVLLSILLVVSGSQLLAQETKTYYGPEADSKVEGASYVEARPEGQLPSFVRLSEDQQIPMDDFFAWFRETFDLNPDIGFEQKDHSRDDLGMEHYRYVQTYKDIPIDKSHYIVHTRDGRVVSFNGQAFRISKAYQVGPELTEAEALEGVLRHVGAKKYMWEEEANEQLLKEMNDNSEATYYPEGKQIWFVDQNGALTLAYQFDIHAASPHSSQRITVDAADGAILKTLPLEYDCEPPKSFPSIWNDDRNVRSEKYTADDFRLMDNCQPASIHVRDWNSDTSGWEPGNWLEIENTDNNWTNMDERFGATVSWATKRSFIYFLNVHGRNSYDNADGDLWAFINARFGAGHSQNNASLGFSGSTAVMRVGLSSAGTLTNSYGTLDIVGHEYVHAVTRTSANLEYEDESGALNESFSDIFGEVIENHALGANDWLMGGERDNGPIRSLENPKLYGQPDTYLGSNWFNINPPCGTGNDNCGVHTNSGVQNYWFYLVATGGSGTNDNGDDFDVQGIGLDDASDIAYRNLVVYLGNNSDHADARAGSIQATIDLYGICSPQYETVIRAWHAVGVGDPFFSATAEVASNYNGSDISCHGACDGSVAVLSVANGTGGPYSYSWSSGSSEQIVEELCSGTYTVTVADVNGCEATASVTLEDPPELEVVPTILSDYNGWPISCHGACDGEAALIASGGTGTISHQWHNGPGTEVYSGMCAGTYSGFVTDLNGCITVSEEITLEAPPPLEIDAGPNQTIFYYDPVDACASIEASGMAGGVPPYTITWSVNGEVVASGAAAEVCMEEQEDTVTTVVYTVTIEDQNGCTETDELSVCYVDIRCQQGNSPQTHVLLCHQTGNGGSGQTLCVSLSALETHLGHNDYVFICDWESPCGDGLAKTSHALQQLVSGQDEDADYFLDAFPNPFTAHTTIRIMVPVEMSGSLRVYDVTGRLVEDLFEGTMHENQLYEVQFDADQLASGSYFYQLVTGDGKIQVKQLLLNN